VSIVILVVQILSSLASLLQLYVLSESERLFGLADEAALGMTPSISCTSSVMMMHLKSLQDGGYMDNQGTLEYPLPPGVAPVAGNTLQSQLFADGGGLLEPLVLSSSRIHVDASVLAWPRNGTSSAA